MSSTAERCRHESAALRAGATGQWTDALRQHVLECEDCAAALAVAPWMAELGAQDVRERPLPDPAIVWMKAQLLRGSAGIERAARPLQIAQLSAYFVVAGGWAALLTWKWSVVQSWVRDFSASHLMQSAASGSLSLSFFAVLLMLSSLTILLALHTILAED